MIRKYHASLGLPESFRAPVGLFKLRPTEHAVRAAKEDKVTLPRVLDVSKATLFEVARTREDQTVRLGYRLPLTLSEADLCLIVDVLSVMWTVVTCWVNRRDDTHRTLRKEEYCHA